MEILRNQRNKAIKEKAGYTLLSTEEVENRIERAKGILSSCSLCPNKCGVNRLKGERGFCGQGSMPGVAYYTIHMGEEPIISGVNGSGTIFFTGCTLKCVFCQNHQISQGEKMYEVISPQTLSNYFLELQKAGAHNINLVTPTPHIMGILQALSESKKHGLNLPIVYNTNGYISDTALELLEGIIDIYIPDLKYGESENGQIFSKVAEYTCHARKSIEKMLNQQPASITDKQGLLRKGSIIRILLLPEGLEGAETSLDYLHSIGGDKQSISIMSQYSPLFMAADYPVLSSGISDAYARKIVSKAEKMGFENIFYQEKGCSAELIPDFTQKNPFERQEKYERE